MTGTVHVIGAGLAGLSAALALTAARRAVTVYEAGPAAGGRCRSYLDRVLGCRIDNGNHMLLSGNHAAHAYLDVLGTRHTMGGPGVPHFPFFDIGTGESWNLRLSGGRVPWWVLRRSWRVPGTRLRDYVALRRLHRPVAGATLAALAGSNPLLRRLVAPLAIAALNTPLEEASAALFATVIRQSFLRGGTACIPSFPRLGLSESFIDPAVAKLRAEGGSVLYGRRVAAMTIEGGRVVSLSTPDGPIAVAADDAVVLAVTPSVAAELLPDLAAPNQFQSIVNLHYRTEAAPGSAGFWGLIGGTAEWVFVKPGIVSVTISAANHLVDEPAEQLASRVWADVRSTCGLPAPMPPWRVVKERRATFAATPAQEARRPGARTPVANLALAGDWTATGLPGTIEGAIRSGRTAAEVLLVV